MRGLLDGFRARTSFSASGALPSRRRPRSPRRIGVDLRLRRAPLDSTRAFSSPNLTPALEPTRGDRNRRSRTARPSSAASPRASATRAGGRPRDTATARGRDDRDHGPVPSGSRADMFIGRYVETAGLGGRLLRILNLGNYLFPHLSLNTPPHAGRAGGGEGMWNPFPCLLFA